MCMCVCSSSTPSRLKLLLNVRNFLKPLFNDDNKQFFSQFFASNFHNWNVYAREKKGKLFYYILSLREFVSKLPFCYDHDDEKLISITHKHCLLQNALLAHICILVIFNAAHMWIKLLLLSSSFVSFAWWSYYTHSTTHSLAHSRMQKYSSCEMEWTNIFLLAYHLGWHCCYGGGFLSVYLELCWGWHSTFSFSLLLLLLHRFSATIFLFQNTVRVCIWACEYLQHYYNM